MYNYAINRTENKEISGFWLHFYVQNAVDWIDFALPTPHYLLHVNSGAFIAWLIDGYPGTNKGQIFLNDVIARVILSLQAERLPYRPYAKERKERAHIHDGPPVKLRELAKGLVSLPSSWAGYNPNTKANGGHDRVFWAIKWKIEQMIKEIGEGVPAPYEALENWAFANFVVETKDKSTLRAKCRSVWNWYDNRNWAIPKRREFAMSKTEAALKASSIKAQRAEKAIMELTTSLIADDYKTKTGKWNISKIARDLKMSRDTVRKYLQELTQNG